MICGLFFSVVYVMALSPKRSSNDDIEPRLTSWGTNMNLKFSSARRMKGSNILMSADQTLPQIKIFFPPQNDLISGKGLGLSATVATRSKRVSPDILTLSKPIFFNNCAEVLF